MTWNGASEKTFYPRLQEFEHAKLETFKSPVSTFKIQIFLFTARLRLWIDCKSITGSGTQGEATGMGVTPRESQAVALDVNREVTRDVTGDCTRVIVGIEGFPSEQDVLNLIAVKYRYVQSVDPSKPEEFSDFITYMQTVGKVLFVDAERGSLIITVECSSLQILQELWADYCTGHLNEMAEKFLVTEDILKTFGLIEIKLTTTVVEEEYEACREYFLKCSGGYNRIEGIYSIKRCPRLSTAYERKNIKERRPRISAAWFFISPVLSCFSIRSG